MSTALSALSILNGTVTGFRSIHSIWKSLNKNENNDIPLEEVPSATEDTIQNQSPISERRPEMSPENLDQTRKQSVADLSELGDVEKIMCILPNGNAVEITPDQTLEYVVLNGKIYLQKGTDKIVLLLKVGPAISHKSKQM